MNMSLEVWAEYACGHESRIVASGKCRASHLKDDLAIIVMQAMTQGEVLFNCSCGRGAAYVEIRLDGNIINRTPASAFLGDPGARLTKRPK